jgi:hypothetical protein
MPMTRPRTALTLLLLLAIVVGSLGSVAANHSGNARWYKDTVPVYDYTNLMLNGYVQQKVDQWNAALGGKLTLRYERVAFHYNCNGVPNKVAGAIIVCNYESGDYPDYPAGVSTITYDKTRQGVKITAVKTILVASRYGTNSGQSGYWWHPMGCHELGHAIGLQHPSEAIGGYDYGGCMAVINDAPNAHDQDEVRDLYRENR